MSDMDDDMYEDDDYDLVSRINQVAIFLTSCTQSQTHKMRGERFTYD